MVGDISLDGKQYISSKRASDLSDYSQDYIGQLARGGYIDAKRVGGMWYISMDSLTSYKDSAETAKSFAEKVASPVSPANEVESLISFDGKDYISAARASQLTGYNSDYVGQLARGGKILSRQVGNRWYVEQDGILAHKQEKDALFAAVQSESVGIYTTAPTHNRATAINFRPKQESLLEYTRDDRDLLPKLKKSDPFEVQTKSKSNPYNHYGDSDEITIEAISKHIPIRKISQHDIQKSPYVSGTYQHSPYQGNTAKKTTVSRKDTKRTLVFGTIAGAALTFVVILSVGITSFKDKSLYASAITAVNIPTNSSVLPSSFGGAITKLGDMIENLLAPQIRYVRK